MTVVSPHQPAKNASPRTGRALLHKKIDQKTVLIDSAPGIMPHADKVEEYLIEVPFVVRPGTPSPRSCRIYVIELVAPTPDSFDAD
jgi:hypothetical protein